MKVSWNLPVLDAWLPIFFSMTFLAWISGLAARPWFTSQPGAAPRGLARCNPGHGTHAQLGRRGNQISGVCDRQRDGGDEFSNGCWACGLDVLSSRYWARH